MPDLQNDPALYRRRLRAELRKAREACELTAKQVTDDQEWSAAKLSRIEAGTVSIARNDLKALLDLYGIRDAETVDRLMEWARRARERSPWWLAYREVASPELLALCGFEASSKVMRNFESLLIPGLLQTEEYARDLFRFLRGPKADQRIDGLVDLRLRRQDILTQPDRHQHFLIDEAVVRRMVGGPVVMRRQLEALKSAMDSDTVSIGVVPFEHGMYRALRVPYVIYEFEDPQDETILYLENPQGESVIYEEAAPPNVDEGVPTPAVYLEVFFELEQVTNRQVTLECLDVALAAIAARTRDRVVLDLKAAGRADDEPEAAQGQVIVPASDEPTPASSADDSPAEPE